MLLVLDYNALLGMIFAGIDLLFKFTSSLLELSGVEMELVEINSKLCSLI